MRGSPPPGRYAQNVVRRSVLPALVPALAAATGLLLAAPASPASATAATSSASARLPAPLPAPAPAPLPAPAAGAPDRYEPALEVTIDSMTPSYLPESGPIRVTGSVTNVDDVPWTTVNLYSFFGDAPLTTEAELAEAARSNPLVFAGKRITEESASDSVGDLEPGETSRYSLTVARDLLRTTGDGVYWFGVHAMGESEDQPRDDVADGRARTFLPFRSAETKGSVKTALVLPLRGYLPYAPDGSLDQLPRLGRTLSIDGRLRNLVDFAASAGTLPVSLLVDPALPDAVRRLAQGNPPRSITPTPASSGEPTPSGSPSGSPSELTSESASQSASESADAATSEDAGAGAGSEEGDAAGDQSGASTSADQDTLDAASGWLGRFAEAAGGSELITLPYGDLDVPAAAAHRPSAYDLARSRPGRVLSTLSGDAAAAPSDLLPAVAAPSGYLDPRGFQLLEPGTTVLLTDEAFGGEAPGVANIEGHRVAVTSSGAADGGPGPGDRYTSLQLRQRILSEGLARLLTPGRRPLVVLMPPQWEADDASAFFTGLDTSWIDQTTVRDAISRTGRAVPVGDLTYPEAQLRRELGPASFEVFDDLVAAGDTLQNLLTRNSGVATTVTDQALAGLSYGARDVPLAARAEMRRSTATIEAELAKVEISAGPGVTLSSSDGGFAAVITNGLDEPVTVGVVASSAGNGIEIAPVEPVEVAADSRATIVLDAHANRAGVSNVTLQLTDVEGNVLGASDTLPIRSAQVSKVIWLILGTGLGLLFLAIIGRLVRRVRRATRLDGEADQPGDDLAAQGTDETVTGTPGSPPSRWAPRRDRRPRRPRRRPEPRPEPRHRGATDQAGILASSAVMAAGTVVSRLSGFVRSALLAAALGFSLHADIFNIGNTVPNMLYILLAGGVFNAVLVPQLVRAQQGDADGGEAYTQRIVTLAALFLAVVTVLLVVAAPLVMALYLDGSWGDPAIAEQRQSVIDFARYCLPQVFFYGMFVLVGQILNARGRFGPMMWAPIANNVISVAVLVVYLVAFGPARGGEATGAFTSQQELLLGIGSTVGIAAQLLILVPYLRSAGFRYRPRLDFRGTGLGHTLRLGSWTVAFVVVNQIAYTIVVRLASGGTTGADTDGTGYAVYSAAFLIVMVPHSVITVSLTTAILPLLSRRAADGDLGRLASDLGSTLRTALVVVVPFAALLPVIAPDLANVVWGHGAARETYSNAVPTLALFGGGLVFFTVHFMMLRGFYALEQTRTVFFIQCAVATTNIATALLLVGLTDARYTAPALVLAYTASYAVGSLLSYLVLRRRLGGLDTPALVGFLVVLALITVVTTAVVLPLGILVHGLAERPSWPVAAGQGLGLTVVAVLIFVWLASRLRLREVTSVLETVGRRLPVLRGR